MTGHQMNECDECKGLKAQVAALTERCARMEKALADQCYGPGCDKCEDDSHENLTITHPGKLGPGTTEPQTKLRIEHHRTFEYDGAFACLDCGATWGAITNAPKFQPKECVKTEPQTKETQ